MCASRSSSSTSTARSIDSGRDHRRVVPPRGANRARPRDPRRGARRRVGGPGLTRRCARSTPDRVDELVARLPRAQRAAARRARVLRGHASTCSTRLHAEGRRLGIVTAKRRATVELAFARLPLEQLLRRRRRRRRHRAAQAATPSRSCSRSSGSAREPDDAVYVGDSPFDVGAARRRACTRSPSRGAASTTSRADAGRDRPTRGGAACAPLRPRRRARRELRELLNRYAPRVPRPRRPAVRTPSTTGSTTSSSRSRSEHPELVTPDSPTQRVGAPPSDKFAKVRAPAADGVAREGDDRRGAEKWADDVRKRLDSDEPVAYVHRAEDRRARDQPHLRERRPRARRDARRRHPGRGRDRQPAHDRRDPAADARRRPAGARSRCAARSTCRSRASAS